MQNKKLVSVRLCEEDLQVIDKACKSSIYRKRSDFICKAVSFMAWAISNSKADKLLKFWPEYGDVVDKYEFQYHRSHK